MTEICKTINPFKYPFLTKGWFLGYYHRYKSDKHDLTSSHLLGFKNGHIPDINQWRELIESNFTPNIKFDLILRVLGSNETKSLWDVPIDTIGHSIAEKLNVPYIPDCLNKNRETRQLKGLKKEERKKEIYGVYEYIAPQNINIKNILLIDDIVTTGSTINEIKRAITVNSNDFNLYLLVLGKTYDSWYDGEGDNSIINTHFSKAPKIYESRELDGLFTEDTYDLDWIERPDN